MAAWGGTEHSSFSSHPALKASRNLASQDSQHFCDSRCLRLCSHLLCARNAPTVHRCIIWWRLRGPIFFKKKNNNPDFPSWFERCRSSFSQQGRLSSASLPAGTEPNFSSDMTVQPLVRKDLLLSLYQWGRGMPHAQMKTRKCFKGRAGPKVMQPTACYATFELERAEHTPDQEITTGCSIIQSARKDPANLICSESVGALISTRRV